MQPGRIPTFLIVIIISFAVACRNVNNNGKEKRVLVYSKTLDFRHTTIEDGIKMLQKIGKEGKLQVTATEDASVFTDDSLKQFDAVIFLSATGEILDHAQQTALKQYMEAGGGFMGIHAASGAEYHWPWYRKLIGAYFKSHPDVQKAKLIVHKDKLFPITDSLPNPWIRTDEWYNWDSIPENVHVLISIDEDSYQGGEHGKNHPLVWYHDFDGGRSFYMELGHTAESYTEPNFVELVREGLQYVMGEKALDYSRVKTLPVPGEQDFKKEILVSNASVQEPMGMSISSEGKIFYIERRGNVRLYDPKTKSVSIIGTVPVYSEHEDGLLGIALAPDFNNNHWIYVFYSAPDNEFSYHLSRFTYNPESNHLDAETEKVLLKIHEEHSYSNHTGGSISFDSAGNLYLSVGDNTIPFDSKGYAPIDQRKDRTEYDAQRSSGNTNDLRGKIIRIHPEPNGTYTIPDENLFPKGMPKTRPEIYVMGCRNPFRISIDSKTGFLYWGEVGPDAGKDSAEGPRGYDEINQARVAGNFGWPFFVADNKAYANVNFATGEIEKFFDPMGPVNNSPRNTGLKILPPAQKAFIWYPYAASTEFPWVGSGGRTAMAGPVYHYDETLKSAIKLPLYYNNALFIYDWIRGWIMAVRMNKNGDYEGMEPFMPGTKFSSIIDMKMGPDGALYVLEYGKTWYQANPDADIARIVYSPKAADSKESASKHTKDDKMPTGAEAGQALIQKNDCMSCHNTDVTSVGPSFESIADRYKNKAGEINRLAEKIIDGGSGVWGSHAMSAHPQLSKEDAILMVKHILSLPGK